MAGTTGFIGSVLILIGSHRTGRRSRRKLPDAWFFGTGNGASGANQNGTFVGIMVLYLGVALMIGSWCEVVRTLRRHPATPVGPVAAMIVAWAVPVLVMPPLFSRDVYSYAAQGEMVSRGINPYIHGPTTLGHGPILGLVDPIWLSAALHTDQLGSDSPGGSSSSPRHDVIAVSRRISDHRADRDRIDRMGSSRSGPVGWP